MGEEPNEIESTGQGGACVSSDETEIRLREGALSRTEEERAPVVCHLCASEPVREPQEAAAASVESWGETSAGRAEPGSAFPSSAIDSVRSSACSECP